MSAALRAGVAYFAIVFAAGFVLGTLRILVLAARLGETAGVALELPLMLATSWFTCGLLLRRFAVPRGWRYRAVMGGLAFLLLMAAELGLSLALFGRTPAAHLATYGRPAAALGLAAQLAFAALPLVRGCRGRRPVADGRPPS